MGMTMSLFPPIVWVWGWPQLTYLALLALGLGYTIAKHGQPRKPYNMFDSLFGLAVVLPLLFIGGFFTA